MGGTGFKIPIDGVGVEEGGGYLRHSMHLERFSESTIIFCLLHASFGITTLIYDRRHRHNGWTKQSLLARLPCGARELGASSMRGKNITIEVLFVRWEFVFFVNHTTLAKSSEYTCSKYWKLIQHLWTRIFGSTQLRHSTIYLFEEWRRMVRNTPTPQRYTHAND